MARNGKSLRLPYQQLIILCICRLAEPIALSSVFPYLPEMIESFDVPEEDVSKWAGIVMASFSLSQAVTGVPWGRASDRFGRKPAIICGMIGIMSTSILFGFSRTLTWAIVARSLAGASNGYIGTLRTTVAEMVPYKELQPRAFSVMPLVWNIGSIFGPAFGGALAKPVEKYPAVLGHSVLLHKFPYALPNMVAGVFFLVSLAVGTLFLRETLETKKYNQDYGRLVGEMLIRPFKGEGKKRSYQKQRTPWLRQSSETIDNNRSRERGKAVTNTPTLAELFTYQSTLNLLAYTLLALHSIAFDQLLPIFMHFPRQTERLLDPNVSLPLKFTGGFGINSGRIGLLFMVNGIYGMIIQFFVFPPLARRLGILNCFKTVVSTFPIVYLLTPFTALLPSPDAQQLGVLVIMLVKSYASIFAFACQIILLTNSATSMRILGTLNGVAISVSALGRAVGPAIAGWTFTLGANSGYGILPWWTLAVIAVIAALPAWWLVEGEGFGETTETDDESELVREEQLSSPDHQSKQSPLPPSGLGGAVGTTEMDGEEGDMLIEEDTPLLRKNSKPPQLSS